MVPPGQGWSCWENVFWKFASIRNMPFASSLKGIILQSAEHFWEMLDPILTEIGGLECLLEAFSIMWGWAVTEYCSINFSYLVGPLN